MEASGMKVVLQDLLEWPRSKSERHLADILNNLAQDVFNEIVNELLEKVTPLDARTYGIENFQSIDRYPNPKDGYISRDEIAERLFVSRDSKERAILLWIWLSFDALKDASDDFDSTEKAFDIVLTLKDFQDMKV